MPALKKFDANVVRHVRLMNKNLCANLIRHDYIVTGKTKAKRAQAEIERFLGRALHQNKKLKSEPLELRLQSVKALTYLQVPDRSEIGSKVLEELSKRYPHRKHGFTRVTKLERRLGEDKAEMAILELVDLDYEIKFWYTAKIVARLELQKRAVDPLTQQNVKKLTQLRPNGEEAFRAAVDEAKTEFFKFDKESEAVESDDVRENLKHFPVNKEGQAPWGRTPRYAVKSRERKQIELPKSPFLA